ncbi:alanine aminotransferase [Anaeramoeba ignava]|uniref:Alanine aminotransferase n=1 Tax=Anaeramoeba ignava TaxID=1746090 RepID=A0A9Q0LBC8_ANAIG|nr:alanine aminotransferase [Anaeramoeba ignava]
MLTPLKDFKKSIQKNPLYKFISPVSMFHDIFKAPPLSVETLSSKVLKTEYAVRGTVVLRALEIEAEMKRDPSKYKFDEIIYCNIGNPQQLKQKPISFFRMVLALCEYPDLLQNPEVEKIFPKDAIERSKIFLKNVVGGMGAYSHSQGIPFIRESVANFISKRDGQKCDGDDIFLTDGASPGVQAILRSITRNENDGIMIPIPQYPLYSASLAMIGAKQVNYYLNEKEGWGLSVDELEKSIQKAHKDNVVVRGLVIINPGNPTGQCLTASNQREIIKFCQKYGLILMADEVYQENVYYKDQKPFSSFRKVLLEMGPEYSSVPLFSFHSISKGFLGECGQRGGYYNTTNIDSAVKHQLYKMASVSLCPNVAGQILIELMVNPPKMGDNSYNNYINERDGIYESLKRRSKKLGEALNKLEGVTCNVPEGAMYAFPRIRLPPKAVEAAKSKGIHPDVFYCLECVQHAGVCIVPGSGFGQEDGTFHFRTTFLPLEEQIDSVVQRLTEFHQDFMKRFK